MLTVSLIILNSANDAWADFSGKSGFKIFGRKIKSKSFFLEIVSQLLLPSYLYSVTSTKFILKNFPLLSSLTTFRC